MFIHNVVFYYYKTKLCVRQILPVTHPRFSPPMQYDTYDRYDYDLPEKGSVATNTPPFSPPFISMIYILSNVHWVSLTKVTVYHLLCLMLRTYPGRSKKATITLPHVPHIVDMLYKTFSRNKGEHYANYH